MRLHRADIVKDVLGGNHIVNARAGALRRRGARRAGLPARRHRRRAGLVHGGGGSESKRVSQWREIGVGAQILRDLGIGSIKLLASAERTYVGLSGFGIEIASTEALGG